MVGGWVGEEGRRMLMMQEIWENDCSMHWLIILVPIRAQRPTTQRSPRPRGSKSGLSRCAIPSRERGDGSCELNGDSQEKKVNLLLTTRLGWCGESNNSEVEIWD